MARPPLGIRRILAGPVEVAPRRLTDEEIANRPRGQTPRPPAPVRRQDRGATITAAFTNNNGCPECGGDLIEGDPITMIDGEWVCEDCADR